MANSDQVYGWLNERILAKLEQNVIPWRRPWNAETIFPSSYNGRVYNGSNFFLLSMMNFSVPVFITAKEVFKRGGKVAKGKNLPVFYYMVGESSQKDENSKPRKWFTFKYYNVWNIEDCTMEDGSPFPLPAWYAKRVAERKQIVFNPIAAADAIVQGYKDAPQAIHGGDRACYIPSIDNIRVPYQENFVATEEYYAVMFHELIHSTGHSSRLNREEVMNGAKYGSHSYSREELVAELGAAYLSAEAGISNEKLEENTVAYIQSWIKKIKHEPKVFAEAAARATKAVNYILNRKFIEKESDENEQPSEVA